MKCVLLVIPLLASCDFYARKEPWRPDAAYADCAVVCQADGSVTEECPGSADQVIAPEAFITVCVKTDDGYKTETYTAADFVIRECGAARYFLGACQ